MTRREDAGRALVRATAGYTTARTTWAMQPEDVQLRSHLRQSAQRLLEAAAAAVEAEVTVRELLPEPLR